MASKDELKFNDPHAPKENGIEAFTVVLSKLKSEILKSRAHWDKHEPKMWSKASGVSNDDLVNFNLEDDLVLISSAPTSYGTIILGKLRLPAIDDGYVHVRIHDPPNRGTEDVTFHSIWTDEGNPNEDGQPTTWNAVHTKDTPLVFFHE